MWQKNVLLKNHCSYQVGGPAKFFFEARNQDELLFAIKEARALKEKIFILGGGTNVLFSDRGFDGLVVKIGLDGIERTGNKLNVGAGVLMKELLDFCIVEGLGGLEWAGGLPGTLGGAIRGNAGAFGGEIKNQVESVTSLIISEEPPRTAKRTNQECRFAYRSSFFKESGGPASAEATAGRQEIIVEAVLDLRPSEPETIKKAIEEKINYRNTRHPMAYPNAGSIFKNVDLKEVPAEHLALVKPVVKTEPFPVVPTAFLISECGLKGQKIGGAMVSDRHPNFIVNAAGATAKDIKTLIALVKKTVGEKFGIRLTEEILIMPD